MYLPHNLDFRGRAYPIPPHLNHIGDDLSRGLLMFDHAKPLGVRGLRWLKIHLANLYGYDKANFDERVQWVENHMDQIVESATKPLEVSSFHQIPPNKRLIDSFPFQGLAVVGQCRRSLAMSCYLHGAQECL